GGSGGGGISRAEHDPRANGFATRGVGRRYPSPRPDQEAPMLKRAILALLLAAPAALRSQSAADSRWLAQCRDLEDAWRARSCEVRVVSLANGGVITVDPGRNGATAVEGWDRDSIEVHARIQAEGGTAGEA